MTAENDNLDAKIISLDAQRAEAGRLSTFTPDIWQSQPVPPRQWCVQDFIPHQNVTLLFGDGGTGKSLLALQLQVALALGQPWLGQQLLEPQKSLGLYCEDDEDELQRRIAAIAEHHDSDLDTLKNMNLACRVAAETNVLVRFGKDDTAQRTPLFQQLVDQALDLDVRLIVLDSLHDIFGGDEIKRNHVRQFISCLRSLALRANCAVVVSAHPSLTGLNSGSGSSGSTAWSNAVRARLYLTRPEGDDADDDARVLKNMKSNYFRRGNTIDLKWSNGVFTVNKPNSDPYRAAEAVFLQCLDKIKGEGRHASHKKNASSYAPRMFARMPQGKGVTTQNLERAMEQLFSTGKICVAWLQKNNRHSVEAIERTTQ